MLFRLDYVPRILDGKSCAFINFFEVEHAVNAKKELNGTWLKNSLIKVGFAKTTVKKGESPIIPLIKKEDDLIVLNMTFQEAMKKALNTPLPKKNK